MKNVINLKKEKIRRKAKKKEEFRQYLWDGIRKKFPEIPPELEEEVNNKVNQITNEAFNG